MISVRLTDPDDVFLGKILKELFNQLNDRIAKTKPFIQDEIADLIIEYVRKSPEVESMESGSLKQHLGFIKPEKFITAMLTSLKSCVHVDFQPFSQTGGHFNISIIRDDFSDFISGMGGRESFDSGPYKVPWLHWLLFEGGSVLVAGYHIQFGNFNRSRAGGAHMEPGGIYRLPPEFTGTSSNNFITRALDTTIDNKIQNIIIKYLS